MSGETDLRVLLASLEPPAFATALGDDGISCNVLDAHQPDHLLVPIDRVDDALACLRRLAVR